MWTENLKVGDVFYSKVYRNGRIRVEWTEHEVNRLTKTQVISGDVRLRKADGRVIGSSSNLYSAARYIVEDTLENRRQHEIYLEATHLLQMVDYIALELPRNMRGVSSDSITALYEDLKEAVGS